MHDVHYVRKGIELKDFNNAGLIFACTPIAQIYTPIGKTAHLSKIRVGYHDVLYIRNHNQNLR